LSSRQSSAELRIVVEHDLLVGEALAVEERLRADAVAAPVGRVHLNPAHRAYNVAVGLPVPVGLQL
jgi:hypothetical protein